MTKFSASETPWVNIYYDIVIQRKPAYYLFAFVLPSFIITTLAIVGIFAPFSDSGAREEKVSMRLTTLLNMALILTLISDRMPKSSEGMAILAFYIILKIAMTAIGSMVSVLVMYQHRKWTAGKRVPGWILTVTRIPLNKDHISSMKAPGFPIFPLSNSGSFPTTVSTLPTYLHKTDEKVHADNGILSNIKKEQSLIYEYVQCMSQQVSEYLQKQKYEENLRKDWQDACQRLDLLLMIIFLMFNCILTASFLAFGYSNLRFIAGQIAT